jgi:hypothetical protein
MVLVLFSRIGQGFTKETDVNPSSPLRCTSNGQLRIRLRQIFTLFCHFFTLDEISPRVAPQLKLGSPECMVTYWQDVKLAILGGFNDVKSIVKV